MRRMNLNTKLIGLFVLLLGLFMSSCRTLELVTKDMNSEVPDAYRGSQDTTCSAAIEWRDFFNDTFLVALVDTALKNNQELNILLQEIEVSKNEVMERKGEYLPFVKFKTAGDVEKVGRYTSKGSSEATTDIEPGRETPDPLPNQMIGAFANWEIDIWHKLRNARKSALMRYLATTEGKNFMVTNLVSEIASSYYELLALDNQLAILQRNIQLQSNALNVVRQQKQAARVTELAVRRFEAQVLNTKSREFAIRQQIVETENRINFLLGRFPRPIERSTQDFTALVPDSIYSGIPSQLLENRPDIKQAELQLAAARLDIKVAKANFYPSLDISAGIGLEAFNPTFLMKTPESMLYSLAGDIAAPLVNRKAIKARYLNANAKQIQAVYEYEQTVLNAYLEVQNQLSRMSNLEKSFGLKQQEVNALTQSVQISNNLFRSARADYMEVLLTQREALDSKFELVETKMQQMNSMVNVYRALGGGWK